MGFSEETFTVVYHIYTMDNTGTNHQKWESTRMEAICAKWYKPNSSFLILLIFPSLIFSWISPNFNVIEIPTPIFILSRFSSFLILLIVQASHLLVDLGVWIDYQL